MVVFIDWSVHSFILDYCISFMEKGKHGHHTFILQKYCSVKFLFPPPFLWTVNMTRALICQQGFNF